MAENKMKEVAKLLGVELGEEFKIYGCDGFCKITELGLERYVKERSWFMDSIMLMDLIKGTTKIVKIPKQILDEKEKEYLSNVIKPKDIKDRLNYIVKRQGSIGRSVDMEFILIMLDDEYFSLPYFKKGTMYKGMKVDKPYSLEELGL